MTTINSNPRAVQRVVEDLMFGDDDYDDDDEVVKTTHTQFQTANTLAHNTAPNFVKDIIELQLTRPTEAGNQTVRHKEKRNQKLFQDQQQQGPPNPKQRDVARSSPMHAYKKKYGNHFPTVQPYLVPQGIALILPYNTTQSPFFKLARDSPSPMKLLPPEPPFKKKRKLTNQRQDSGLIANYTNAHLTNQSPSGGKVHPVSTKSHAKNKSPSSQKVQKKQIKSKIVSIDVKPMLPQLSQLHETTSPEIKSRKKETQNKQTSQREKSSSQMQMYSKNHRQLDYNVHSSIDSVETLPPQRSPLAYEDDNLTQEIQFSSSDKSDEHQIQVGNQDYQDDLANLAVKKIPLSSLSRAMKGKQQSEYNYSAVSPLKQQQQAPLIRFKHEISAPDRITPKRVANLQNTGQSWQSQLQHQNSQTSYENLMNFSLEQDISLANNRLDRLKQKQLQKKNTNGGILKANSSQTGNFLPIIETPQKPVLLNQTIDQSTGFSRRNTIGVMRVRFNIDKDNQKVN